MINPDDILTFWIDETGEEGWYRQSDALDAEIRRRFQDVWEAARNHQLGWTPTPHSTLALLIVLDQFPRNMFRGDPRAFATDRLALAKAKCAIEKDWDLRIDGPARQFFYMPFEHSECLADQERAVRLFLERMPESSENLLHAQAHRDVIRRFGRFPTRNAVLSRSSTEAETSFLGDGGYGRVVDSLRQAS
ncbi:MAG: DUF924 domain-containing protein [Rhodobacteraceae bacterium]|nr:DUF924 domain-containing protein [Paracoccaceae bacterium]